MAMTEGYVLPEGKCLGLFFVSTLDMPDIGFEWKSDINFEVYPWAQGKLSQRWAASNNLWLALEYFPGDAVKNGWDQTFIPRGTVIACSYDRRCIAEFIRSHTPAENTGNFLFVGKHTVGDHQSLVVGDGESATAGEGGYAEAGMGGTAVAGKGGTAIAGDWGFAYAGDEGYAEAGQFGHAVTGHKGVSLARANGHAEAGDGGTAVVGDGGTVVVGKFGQAVMTGSGKAMVGDCGILRLRRKGSEDQIFLFHQGQLKPDTFYTVSSCGSLKEVLG